MLSLISHTGPCARNEARHETHSFVEHTAEKTVVKLRPLLFYN